jgi:hypothetical protein
MNISTAATKWEMKFKLSKNPRKNQKRHQLDKKFLFLLPGTTSTTLYSLWLCFQNSTHLLSTTKLYLSLLFPHKKERNNYRAVKKNAEND